MKNLCTKDQILKSHQERFACKVFDKNKKISKEDLEFILEIARLSPSAMGIEPWKFLVIKDTNLRQKLKPICWDQDQITDASELIVILSRTKYSLFEKGYIKDICTQRKRDLDRCNNYIKNLPNINEWTKKQCYIVLANIMSSAKMIGIDSCAIEGFDSSYEVAKTLGVDTDIFDVALLVALGYRDMSITPKSRLDFDKVVEFL